MSSHQIQGERGCQSNQGNVSTTANQITVVGQSVTVDWTPNTFTFPTVTFPAVTATQNFTLTNNTATPLLNCGAVTFTAPDAFRVVADTCETLNLLPGAACTVTLQGVPYDTTGGKGTTMRVRLRV